MVAVMACDDEIIPLQARIEMVADDNAGRRRSHGLRSGRRGRTNGGRGLNGLRRLLHRTDDFRLAHLDAAIEARYCCHVSSLFQISDTLRVSVIVRNRGTQNNETDNRANAPLLPSHRLAMSPASSVWGMAMSWEVHMLVCSLNKSNVAGILRPLSIRLPGALALERVMHFGRPMIHWRHGTQSLPQRCHR